MFTLIQLNPDVRDRWQWLHHVEDSHLGHKRSGEGGSSSQSRRRSVREIDGDQGRGKRRRSGCGDEKGNIDRANRVMDRAASEPPDRSSMVLAAQHEHTRMVVAHCLGEYPSRVAHPHLESRECFCGNLTGLGFLDCLPFALEQLLGDALTLFGGTAAERQM